eukprot:scaffold73336_cov59-Phaeocystis_antarctica.AAC.2
MPGCQWNLARVGVGVGVGMRAYHDIAPMYIYVESGEAATVRSSRSKSPACRKASSSIFPMKRALEWCTTAYCSHTARLSTGPRNRVSFHATVGARTTSLYRSCSASSSWSSHCGELPLRTTNEAPMWPLLTLAHCSHECLMPRRRSKYLGADIMPSTTKGPATPRAVLETDMFFDGPQVEIPAAERRDRPPAVLAS